MSIGQFVSTDGIATDDLFQRAAAWLEAKSRGPWILDLRDNGGGAVVASERIASALVPPGSDLVVYTQRELDTVTFSGYTRIDTSRAIGDVPRRLADRKIIVLQDSNTASASEILVSALRENLGTEIVTLGDTSFGKGIGQIYMPTRLDGYMAVTCMRIDPLRSPRYHGIGIPPDRATPYGDSTIATAWRIALGVAGRNLSNATAVGPGFQALEWNRKQSAASPREPSFPAGRTRPFPVR